MAPKELQCFLFVCFFALGSATYCTYDSDCSYSESCCDYVCRDRCFCSYDDQCGWGEKCCNSKCSSSSSCRSCTYDYEYMNKLIPLQRDLLFFYILLLADRIFSRSFNSICYVDVEQYLHSCFNMQVMTGYPILHHPLTGHPIQLRILHPRYKDNATYCTYDSDCSFSESCCTDKVCRERCYYCSHDYQCGTNEQCCNRKCISSFSSCSCTYDYHGGSIAGAVIGTIIFFAIIISIVSCCCCACCPYYRYRTPGAVVQQIFSTQMMTTQQVHAPPPVNYNLPSPDGYDHPPPAGYNLPTPAGYDQPPPGFNQAPQSYASYPPPPNQYPPPLRQAQAAPIPAAVNAK
ncbi:unnamed protein product [Pocillopora meandrina]|uniref:Uncharacterized protein n=1 Tax=Pocillopora meandrina TaxID=46732 RepID=A0AAU9XW99_9CNID|nr:unnamed protein product [Pocillopora meandrina]